MNSQGPREVGLGGFRLPNIRNPRAVGIGLLVLLGALVLVSSVFTVAPEEVGVVLTFGKYTREAEPGLRIKWPRPIQTVMKVPVQRQLKVEFGFRTATAGVRTQYTAGAFTDESLMLTGDLNVAVVEWTTQFRVADSYKYLFQVRNLYDSSVNEVLTIGRQEIASEVERRLQELCDQYETGIKIEQIVLQDVNPPDQVRPAFNEVNQAQQEKERMINEARAQYNAVIPRIVSTAHGVTLSCSGRCWLPIAGRRR
jgi:membrane protease subunit HflK